MSRLERDELFLSRIFNRLSLSLRLDRSIMDSFESATSVSYSPSHITKGNSCAPLDFTSCPLWGNASMLEANASTSSISNKVNSSHSKKKKRLENLPYNLPSGNRLISDAFSLSQLVLLNRSCVLPKRRVYATIVLQLFLGKI